MALTNVETGRAVAVHLARVLSGRTAVDAIGDMASSDRVGLHRLVQDPEEADVILFVDCHLLPPHPLLPAIRDHPLRTAHPHKTVIYDERDYPTLFMPGITVSMPSHSFSPRFQAAWAYYSIEDPGVAVQDPDLLFSFVGSASHPVRRDIYSLRHHRAVVEEVNNFTFYDVTSPHFEERRNRFREVMRRSKFVLCPRGQGASSIRLYETLAAGRVPVIIADHWTPPVGPRWSECSLLWPEHRVAELPRVLETLEPRFEQMGLAARYEYERWFHPTVAFHHLASLAGELVTRGAARDYQPSLARNRALLAAYEHHFRFELHKPWVAAKAGLRRSLSHHPRSHGRPLRNRSVVG
jgi:hypothetical protein